MFTWSDTCPLCGSLQDISGYHSLVCKHGGDGVHRHDALRDTAYPYFRQAGLNPLRETPGLIRDSRTKPGDIYGPSDRLGEATAFDFAITNALQSTNLPFAAAVAGGAAIRYGDMKRDKYTAVLLDQDIPVRFIPMVMDAFGA